MIIRDQQKREKKNKEQKINRHKMPEKRTERKKPPRKTKEESPERNPPLRAWAKARVIRSTAAQLRIRLALRFPKKLKMFLGPKQKGEVRCFSFLSYLP